MALILVFVSLIAGAIIGAFLGKYLMMKTRLPQIMFRKQREIKKILNNPELLKKKLEEGPQCIIDGKKLAYKISEINGKKQLEYVYHPLEK